MINFRHIARMTTPYILAILSSTLFARTTMAVSPNHASPPLEKGRKQNMPLTKDNGLVNLIDSALVLLEIRSRFPPADVNKRNILVQRLFPGYSYVGNIDDRGYLEFLVKKDSLSSPIKCFALASAGITNVSGDAFFYALIPDGGCESFPEESFNARYGNPRRTQSAAPPLIDLTQSRGVLHPLDMLVYNIFDKHSHEYRLFLWTSKSNSTLYAIRIETKES